MKLKNNLIPAAMIGLIALTAGCVPVATGLPAGVQIPLPSKQAMRQAAAPRPLDRKPVVIENNRGGNVMAAISRRNQLEKWGGPVEIRGYCGSACTLFITLPNACLGKNATVGFHAPRLPGTHIIPPGVDDIMANYYRGGIKQRWNATWKHSLAIQRISADEYRRLDPQTRTCAPKG